MATAFNPSSVIANVSVEAPDFSMLTKAAASVQGRYLEGFNKYKSTITSLLNANITSDDNKKFRSEYFKKIDEYLNNLSGVDFSNPGNVSVASALMEPLVKDREFVTDLNFSSMQASERSKLEQVRSSTDEKVFSQYSPVMEAAMGYAEQDMKNAKRGNGSIFKVSPQKFVPFANIQNVLNEAAAKQKLQIKEDRLTGAYIVTDVNGRQAIPNFTDWARQQMGDTYDQQFLVSGKVKVRQQIDALMQSDPNMTKEQAYQQVAKDNSLGIYANHEDYKKGLNDGIANIDIELKKIKNKYKNYVPKGSQDEQMYNQLSELKTKYETELADLASNQTDKDQQIQNVFQQFMNNPEYSLLPSMKDSLAKGWAQTYAMSNAERSIQVNQKVLQDENHAWQKFMAGYNFDLDLKRKNADYLYGIEEKKLDWEIFKKQEDYKLNNDKDKATFQARLDFEKALAGAGGGSGSGGGGGNFGTGKITPGAPRSAEQDIDLNQMYQNQLSDLQTTALDGYLNETVLQAATHDSDKYLHTAAQSALMNVMQNYATYGKPGSKTFQGANDQYKKDYNTALGFLKLINGNINAINSTSDIPNTILAGVRSYSGDFLKYKEANDKVRQGALAFSDYVSLKKKEEEMIKNLPESYKTTEYWVEEKDKNGKPTGRTIPRTDASNSWYSRLPLVGGYAFTEEKRDAFLERIIPNYNALKNRAGERSSTANIVNDPKSFNYNAIGELIQKAYKIDGIGSNKGSKEDIEDYRKWQTKYGNLGAQLANYFVPSFNIAKLPTGDFRIEVPLQTKKDGTPLLGGANEPSAVFYVSASDANNIWGATGETSFLGKTYNYPVYGDLSNVANYFRQAGEPVSWIIDGLAKGSSKVDLPSYMFTHGIEDGYITFDKVKSELYVGVKARGRWKEYPADITYGEYLNNQSGKSQEINSLIEQTLNTVKNYIISDMEKNQRTHAQNVVNNSNNYVKLS